MTVSWLLTLLSQALRRSKNRVNINLMVFTPDNVQAVRIKL